nr:pyruvate ferredoxin oxidoreductase delta subunit, POR delta {N-terminal} [Pyrococcus furiosus, Peptide Partial, 17 aa] [Pyrococcus furiosus]
AESPFKADIERAQKELS